VILILAQSSSRPLAVEIASAARGRGHRTPHIACDLADLVWEVQVDTGGRSHAELAYRPTGQTIDVVVSLTIPSCTAGDDFGAAERLASWWALLAGFDGVVINRPTRHGLTFSIDSLRTEGCAVAPPGRWVLRDTWSTDRHALVRSAADMSYLDTVTPQSTFSCADKVLDITECCPSHVHRIAIAGNNVITLDPHRQLPPTLTEHVKDVLAPYLPAAAVAVLEERDGLCHRILDIVPSPSRAMLEGAADRVLDALMEAIQ
jgi:hypothetical protein